MEASHASALQQKHADLERRIGEEMSRPMPDETLIHDLKKKKLAHLAREKGDGTTCYGHRAKTLQHDRNNIHFLRVCWRGHPVGSRWR